ncbi:16S rRNA (cytosine(1402)-N(4))-methyltransferase RsmH [Cysteiniphilum sp. QT6929]|uniref:16S rRNA (cytosine(1402)-N(4))-methyltransferase RsmH n=1 Tax=Cysteiniphilum sp. QT6929 TaxID=2975055 RepID=UPI0024B37629|nr:16S rRNA (cytosine(1402)-N(4))-methyltransferase RsmH [Cysteiniphilum sp. QT6929]WHN65559.1 16S rRNA (cytosine(1402)-N(4))-methyltransferase RsmH [Cysteiniphilum sp. QT6929]
MHYSVLLNESIAALAIKVDGIYVDGTFGRGGHSRQILAGLTTGKLIAFDRDLEAIEYAKVHFKAEIESGKLILVHAPFSTMAHALTELGFAGKVDGVLLDLGVSSPQLDVAERGFSFMKDGPLDMRMDQTKGLSAEDILINYDAEELAHIFREYGEEKHAWRIAQAIKAALAKGDILDRTLKLASLIEKTIGKKEKKHPATRCFQALRICVNAELDEVSTTLNDAFEVLKPSGHLAVISFHSLEDRIVKQFMTKLVKGEDKKLPRGMPILEEFVPKAKWCVKQGKASSKELEENVRSRSAILRAVERL